MKEMLLVRYGEIALKGKNIRTFERKLISNIRKAISDIPDTIIHDQRGRVVIEHELQDQEALIKAVTKVFGIVSVSPATRLDRDIEAIKEGCLTLLKKMIDENGVKSFKVEARRADKHYPLNSPEINHTVGGYLFKNLQPIRVDVNNPEVVIHIEIRDYAYVFIKKIPGLGGMPYGSAGKGMLLLSGGIDSPVAGYLMARRGLELEAVHFHSFPFTSERAMEKVIDLAKRLTYYTENLRIHSINILEIQKAINEHCPSEESTILARSFMMKIAEKLSDKSRCKALITGENLGQVASQTIEGMTVTNSMVDIPVFRPLVAYDKNDIIDVARKIDTFETSILPFEDCCTIFLPDRVVTKPRLEKIEASLSKLNIDELIDEAIRQKEAIIVVKGEVTSRFHPNLDSE